MVVLILLAVIVLLILAVVALGLWGAATAATGLTLAATNAANQMTATLLACALVAALPLIIYGAFRLGVTRRESLNDRDISPSIVVLPQDDDTPTLAERGIGKIETSRPIAALPEPKRVRTFRRRNRVRIVRRWFQ